MNVIIKEALLCFSGVFRHPRTNRGEWFSLLLRCFWRAEMKLIPTLAVLVAVVRWIAAVIPDFLAIQYGLVVSTDLTFHGEFLVNLSDGLVVVDPLVMLPFLLQKDRIAGGYPAGLAGHIGGLSFQAS